ncbi:MAG: CoA transferase subunit A [Promethearchaeota archaeon]|jgi:glutaconate CoA-transferase subunit A
MVNSKNKVMSLKKAISDNVKDGDELILGNYTLSMCVALASEVIRQKKKHLTVYSQSSHIDLEYLAAGDCIDKIITNFITVVRGTGNVVRRMHKGEIEVEEYSNFHYNARLQAGMYGFSFMPVLEGAIETDLFKTRTFMGENKFKVIKCPYTGKNILTVPAANPDVCIIHVQRADKYGNAQYWGAMGSVQAAALASKKIVVSCEEIVDYEIIKSSPHHTIIPAYRTNAVVEAKYGAHPTPVAGYYKNDQFFMDWAFGLMTTDEGIKRWLDEWIYGCKDHDAYIQKYLEIFGNDMLNSLKYNPYYSTPVNYGSPHPSWDDEGVNKTLGIKYEDIENIMEKEGLFHE